MKILILSPYPPYPPHGGGTMRVYQLIRGLAARHRVTCLTFAPTAAAERELEPLRAMCTVRCVRGPDPRGLARRAWTTLVSPLPDMALRNASAAYGAALADLLASERFDVIQAESIEMARYLPRQTAEGPLVVLDQFNVENTLQRRAAQASLGAIRAGSVASRLRGLAGAAYSLVQSVKLARYERGVMRRSGAVLAVSDEDRRALAALAPQVPMAVVPNGVDTAFFSRKALAAARADTIVLQAPALVFTGTMDFRPNVDAVTWFAHEILPLVRARRPETRLVVVGRSPGAGLRALGDGVVVLGGVPDARPFVAGASVYVIPMRIGGGVRLKLLEALSLEAPVVSTSIGAEGVRGLQHEKHCLVADEPAQFAAAVLRLLDAPEQGRALGAAGRDLVRGGYDWATIIPALERLYTSLRTSKEETMEANERQQRMLERVQEDERLRGDLPDPAAKALVEWASNKVSAAAADPNRPDEQVEADVMAIRAAARAAARSGEEQPEALLAQAEQQLGAKAEKQPDAKAETTAAATPQPEQPDAKAETTAARPTQTDQTAVATPAPPRTGWSRPRRRWLQRFRSWFRQSGKD